MVRSRRPHRPAAALLGAALLAAPLAGCAGSPQGASASATWPGMVTREYLPGLAADVHVPDLGSDEPVPVVLLVPGGGWQTADRAGLSPLAAALAGAGMLAVNATYSAGVDGAVFPEPVHDISCAAGFAVAQAESEGLTPGPLVLLGHSAGGHLAALAALDSGADSDADSPGTATTPGTGATTGGSGCPYPSAAVDGLIGLAGIYDTAPFEDALIGFFGTTRAEDPASWAAGDPITRVAAGQAPERLHVLLRHGDADDLVPVAESQAFATALQAAGIPVRLDVVQGVDHAGIYSVGVSAEPVIAWIRQQWPDPPPAGT